MDVSKLEYLFASELVLNVMQRCGSNWLPENISSENNSNSPVTFKIRNALEMIWIDKSDFICDLFCTASKMNSVSLRVYEDSAKFACHCFLESQYDELELLKCFVIISGLAAIFYQNSVFDAPYIAIRLIYETINSLKERNVFNDVSSWLQIDLASEAYVRGLSENEASVNTDKSSSSELSDMFKQNVTLESTSFRATGHKEVPQTSRSKNYSGVCTSNRSLYSNSAKKMRSTNREEGQPCNPKRGKSHFTETTVGGVMSTEIENRKCSSDKTGLKTSIIKNPVFKVPFDKVYDDNKSVITVNSTKTTKVGNTECEVSYDNVANTEDKNFKSEVSLSNLFQSKISLKDNSNEAASSNICSSKGNTSRDSNSAESNMVHVVNFTPVKSAQSTNVSNHKQKSKIPVRVNASSGVTKEISPIQIDTVVTNSPPMQTVPKEDSDSKRILRPRTFKFYAED